MAIKKTILILAANPKDTQRLRLDEEVREIKTGLLLSPNREAFNIEQEWAVRSEDLRRALLNYQPNIVHFCGHGDAEGIVLEDANGESVSLKPQALSGLFEIFSDRVACVVLNCCYSERQATAISQHIRYVIGMKKAIGDEAAIAFTVGFYDGLGAGKSIDDAFALGRNAIQLKNIPENLTPILKKNPALRSKEATKFSYEKGRANDSGVQRIPKPKISTVWDKKLTRISLMVGIVLSLLGIGEIVCKLICIPPDAKIEISGIVMEQRTRMAIKGARITIDGEKFGAWTNDHGEYREFLEYVPQNTKIRVRVSHDLYKSAFEERIISSKEALRVNFFLESRTN